MSNLLSDGELERLASLSHSGGKGDPQRDVRRLLLHIDAMKEIQAARATQAPFSDKDCDLMHAQAMQRTPQEFRDYLRACIAQATPADHSVPVAIADMHAVSSIVDKWMRDNSVLLAGDQYASMVELAATVARVTRDTDHIGASTKMVKTPNAKLDIDALRKVAEAAPSGRWSVWTSNSWRRVFSDQVGKHVTVVEPVTQHDGHVDLLFGAGVATYLETFTADIVLELLEQLEAALRQLKAYAARDRDALLYGNGFMLRRPDGTMEHIPADQVSIAVPAPSLNKRADEPESAWQTGTPPTKAGDYDEYIVAVRRKAVPGRIFVFASNYANSYGKEELNDQDGNEYIANGWYTVGHDTSGEFDSLFMPMLESGDEVIGWQPLPKWGGTAC